VTYKIPSWDPHSTRFGKALEAMLDQSGNLREPKQQGRQYNLSTVDYIPSYFHLGRMMAYNLSMLKTSGLGVKVDAIRLVQR